jgi:large subunit ribosomal protein L13e
LKAAGLNAKYARTVGIAVDARRRTKCEESLKLNADRLKDYASRLVVFSKSKKPTADVTQFTGALAPKTVAQEAVSYTELTEDLKNFRAYASLRQARADARLVGIRQKQAASKKDEKAADE